MRASMNVCNRRDIRFKVNWRYFSVDPDYQKRGIDTYMLREALAANAAVATLTVFERIASACVRVL